MKKVKVSKEVEEAIIEAKDNYSSVELVELHFHRNLKRLNDLDRDTLIRALYIGYEVEQTPEDKVREFYGMFTQPVSSQDLYKGELVARAIRDTLDYLNIKIKGVND